MRAKALLHLGQLPNIILDDVFCRTITVLQCLQFLVTLLGFASATFGTCSIPHLHSFGDLSSA